VKELACLKVRDLGKDYHSAGLKASNLMDSVSTLATMMAH